MGTACGGGIMVWVNTVVFSNHYTVLRAREREYVYRK